MAVYVFDRFTHQIAQVRSSTAFGAAVDYGIAVTDIKSAQTLLKFLSLAKSFSEYVVTLEAIGPATQGVRLRTLILNCIHEDHLQRAVIRSLRIVQHFAYVLPNVSPRRSVCGHWSCHATILIVVRAFEYEYEFRLRQLWLLALLNKSGFIFEFVQFIAVSGYIADILVLADSCLVVATTPNLLGVDFKNFCNVLHHDLLTDIYAPRRIYQRSIVLMAGRKQLKP